MSSDKIFESNTIKEKVNEQIKAIRLLALQGYTILDLENNIITKWDFQKKDKKKNISYTKLTKLKI
jgi:RecA-family ATPase